MPRPELNAAGRLDDMTVGIKCLLASSLDDARECAVQLDALNRERREIEQSMLADAELLLTRHPVDADDRYGIVVFDPSWHEGVVGLIAGALRERCHRPVVAFAESSNGRELKGSARSLPELHVRDALDAIAARNPALLTKFWRPRHGRRHEHQPPMPLSGSPRLLTKRCAAGCRLWPCSPEWRRTANLRLRN